MLATNSARTAECLQQPSSSDPPVVVMESAEHRHSMDASVCCTRTWNRLLLFERLMWTRLIVEAHVLGDDAPEMILAEDEHVVEQLSPSVPTNRSANAFMFGALTAVRTIRTPDDLNTPAKRAPSFAS